MRGLFLEGLIFGGAYLRRDICVSKSIVLALYLNIFIVFALFSFEFEGNFPSTSPRGAYIWRGDLTEGFFALPVWGAYIWGGLYKEGLNLGILRYFECFATMPMFADAHISSLGYL